MTFWSSQTLSSQLPEIIPSGGAPKVDCNAVTLTVGANCYVTSADGVGPRNETQTMQTLESSGCITIPPGQFGFLETAEIVKLHDGIMGFISFKATYKMKGLVNVSGFHVDPGWEGHLRFAVFNAGPNPVHLQCGMQLFLLWIANLDEPSEQYREQPSSPDDFIKMVNNVPGAVNSGYRLSERMEALEEANVSILAELGVLKTIAIGIAIALAVGGGGLLTSKVIDAIEAGHPPQNSPFETTSAVATEDARNSSAALEE